MAGAEELPPPPGVLRLPPVGAPEGDRGPALEPASAPDPDPPADDEAPTEPNDAVPADAPPQYVPVFLFPAYQEITAWSGSFELGLDGTTGNSETFNFRFGFDTTHQWDIHQLDVELDYLRKTTGRIETANRALLDWRYERLFRDTRWTWFVHGTFEYDEFEAWDCRVTADTGLGYQLISTDSTKLVSRTGGGFARTVGLPDDRWTPELVMGLDFEHKVGKRHRLKAKVDYIPDVTDFAGYRVNSQGSWEMLIDEAMNLSLKLSVRSRYDSTPRPAKPHDLDYSAVVMWRF
ncbi:MAG: DUF481 domain-containing protein, partial [Thermoguttaceae bacterium]